MIRRLGSSGRVIGIAAALALAGCAASTPAPVERRGVATRPAPASAQPSAPQDAAREIVVPEGATLSQIADEERLSLEALVAANSLASPDRLDAGQRLVLPEPVTYVVRPGDTLAAIARAHSIQPRSLALYNGLDAPYALRVGQTLKLPGPPIEEAGRGAGVPAGGATTATAAAAGAARSGSAPTFAWPMTGRVIDGFGLKGEGRRNDGVNIAAREGEPVRAAADGVVVYAAGDLESYGQLVLIAHAGGWISAYAHNSRLLVGEDQTVRQGDEIAEAGATGAVSAPQLHFELRRAGAPVDPLTALPPRPG